MNSSVSYLLRQWRNSPTEPLLGWLTMVFTSAVILIAGTEWDKLDSRGRLPDGQQLYVVRSISLKENSRTGLYPAQIEALGGTAAVAQLITSPLMRFNLAFGDLRRAELVGAADITSLHWLGARLIHGTYWRPEDPALNLVLTRQSAVAWFGDSAKAVGAALDIQGRLFTVTGVIDAALPGFPEVDIWTNQVEHVESLFNNELRYRPAAFCLIRRPASMTPGNVDQEVASIGARVAELEGPSFLGRQMVAQPLADYLLREELRLRGGLLQILGLALLSAWISVWLVYSARSMRQIGSYQIRLFLGLGRPGLYWELVLEQALLAGATVVALLLWASGQAWGVWPRTSWFLLCLMVPILNAVVNSAFLAMLIQFKQGAKLRLEPFIACHAATTVVLWMLTGLFYQDFRAAQMQSREVSPDTYQTLLAMPATDDPVFSRKFAEQLVERLTARAPRVRLGYSTWLPFLDSSSTDFLHLASEDPVSGGNDPRLVEFLPANAEFVAAFHPRLLAGRLPTAADQLKAWIVLDLAAAQRHFPTPQQAIGRNVKLLRGDFQVLAVIDRLPFRGAELNPLPQVFLNVQTEKMLFPYLAMTIEIPDAPARAPELLRQEIRQVDGRIAAFRMERVRDSIDRAVAPNRTVMQWLGLLIFTVNLALALGVFSLAKAILTFRQTDFGTMLALGARLRNLTQVAFTRLALFCTLGIIVGAWLGVLYCWEFQDQIRPDPDFLLAAGLQAVAAIVVSTSLALAFPMRQLFLRPLAQLLKEQPRAGRLPWA